MGCDEDNGHTEGEWWQAEGVGGGGATETIWSEHMHAVVVGLRVISKQQRGVHGLVSRPRCIGRCGWCLRRQIRAQSAQTPVSKTGRFSGVHNGHRTIYI